MLLHPGEMLHEVHLLCALSMLGPASGIRLADGADYVASQYFFPYQGWVPALQGD